MLHALFLILVVAAGLWLSFCPMLSIYWAFKPDAKPANQEGKLAYSTFVGALLGFGSFFARGFYAALFFVPHSWCAFDEDGEFVSKRYSWAILLGVLAAFFVMLLLHRVESLVRENQALKRNATPERPTITG
jgi:hypothetical protein